MQAKDIMSQPVITVTGETSLEETARALLANRIGGVPVVDAHGELRGMVTESDFAAKERGLPFSTFRSPQVLGEWLTAENLDRIYHEARSRKVEEIMSRDVVAAGEDDSVERVLELMLRHDFNRIPVVRDGRPVGIVARHDLLRMMLREKAG